VFPFLNWLPNYQLKYLRNDVLAGITVAIMLIPQGMALALLAGLPPIVGLYASTLPMVVYALMGTSRHLSVGPVALVALFVAAGVGKYAESGSGEYLALTLLLALMVGAIQLVMGIARLGYLVNFLSHPVISGFTSAAALIIAVNQLQHLFGFATPSEPKFYKTVAYLIGHISELHILTFILGILCIIGLAAARLRKRFPGALLVVGLGILLVWGMSLHEKGIAIVGAVPQGLPVFALPEFNLDLIRNLATSALTIALIGYMASIAMAKRLASKHRDEVDANQELIALGLANLSAGIFQGFPVAGGFSRSAVNADSGAQTPVSAIVTAATIALTLLFLTPLFYYLPKVALASIIIVAVSGLIDVRGALQIYKVRRSDFLVLAFAFLSTLLLGVDTGILLSILASLVIVINRSVHPFTATLGRMPDSDVYRNIERFEDAKEIEGLVIFRIDAALYFANISYLRDRLDRCLSRRPDAKVFLFDGGGISDLDSSAAEAMHDIADMLALNGVELWFSNVRGQVRDVMARSGFSLKLGPDVFFYSKKEAVSHYLSLYPDG